MRFKIIQVIFVVSLFFMVVSLTRGFDNPQKVDQAHLSDVMASTVNGIDCEYTLTGQRDLIIREHVLLNGCIISLEKGSVRITGNYSGLVMSLVKRDPAHGLGIDPIIIESQVDHTSIIGNTFITAEPGTPVFDYPNNNYIYGSTRGKNNDRAQNARTTRLD